ncbi:hypothetical protein LCGC14_1071000 [marine sediment metagenome]|uniref:Uncharacterized protein n=1 Tax=marine sediment metagenome TaxID=412755 RepID=A0A0F9QP26_9ZZZZ
MHFNIDGNQMDLLGLLKNSNELTFLVGAGCSYDSPSNLETGFSIMKSLLKLACMKSEFQSILQLINNGKLRFEMLIELFRNNIDPTMELFKYFSQPQKLNNQHYFLAEKIKNGNHLITVNFDNLIEIALMNSGISKKNIIPVIDKNDFLKYYNPRELAKENLFPVYKIHGSSKNIISNKSTLDSLIATIHALGKRKSRHTLFSVEPYKSFALKNLLEDRILIVIGYSGSDDFDIIPSLKKFTNIKAILWFNHIKEDNTHHISEVEIPGQNSQNKDPLDIILKDLKFNLKKIPIFRIDINFSSFLMKIKKPGRRNKLKHINYLPLWLKNKFRRIEYHKVIYFTYQIYVSVNFFRKSLDLAKILLLHSLKVKDIEINIYALAMLGIDYFSFGNIFKSIFYAKKTLRIMQEFKYSKPLKAMVISNLGIIYRKLGNIDKAKEFFQEALEISINLNDEENSATYMSNLADVLIDNKDFFEAKKLLKKALRIDRKLGNLDSMSYHLSNLAHLYSEQKMNSKAMELLNKSLYIEKGMRDSRGIIQRINNIGNVYYYQGDLIKARRWYRKALFLLIRNNYPEENYECYNNLGAIYLDLYDYNKALCYHQLALNQLRKIGRTDSVEFERLNNIIEDIKKNPFYVP